MKVKTLSLIAIVAVAIFAPRMAQAYCTGWDKDLPGYRPDYYSTAREYARAKYVAVIQVTRETWLGEDGKPKPLRPPFQYKRSRPWGFDPYIGAYYDAKILTGYKGDPPRTISLFSENSTARFWLRPGVRYLAFVTEEQEEELQNRTVLTLDTCGNSQRWREGSKVLRVVQRLASLRPSSARQ